MALKSPPAPWYMRLLGFLRLVDPHDSALSITSIAMMIALYKLVTLETLTLTELSAFLGCLGLYHLKRRSRPTPTAAAEPTSEVLAQVTAARDDLKAHTDKLRLMLETVALGRR